MYVCIYEYICVCVCVCVSEAVSLKEGKRGREFGRKLDEFGLCNVDGVTPPPRYYK